MEYDLPFIRNSSAAYAAQFNSPSYLSDWHAKRRAQKGSVPFTREENLFLVQAWDLDPAILSVDLGPPPLNLSSIPDPTPFDREKDFCCRRRGENWTFSSELQDEWLTEIECAEMIKLLENELKYPPSHILRKGPQRDLDHDMLRELRMGFVNRFKGGEFRKQGVHPDLDERERKRNEEIKIVEKRKHDAEKTRRRREDLAEVPEPSGCVRFDKTFAKGLEIISGMNWDDPEPKTVERPWQGEPSSDTWMKFQGIFDNALDMVERHQKEEMPGNELRNILEKWAYMAHAGEVVTEVPVDVGLSGLGGPVGGATDFCLRNFLPEHAGGLEDLPTEPQWGNVSPPAEKGPVGAATVEGLGGATTPPAPEVDPRPKPLAVLQPGTAEKGGDNPHKRRAVGIPDAMPAKRRRRASPERALHLVQHFPIPPSYARPLPPPPQNVALPAPPPALAAPPMVLPIHMAGHEFRQPPGLGMPLWHSNPAPTMTMTTPPSASTRKRKASESPPRATPAKRGTAVPPMTVPPGPRAITGRGSVPPTPGTTWYPGQGPPSGVPPSLIPRGTVTAAPPLQSPVYFPPPALAVNPPPPPAAANTPQLQRQPVYIDLTLSPDLTPTAIPAPALLSVKRQKVSAAAAEPATKPRMPRKPWKPKNPAPLPPIRLPPPYRRPPAA